MDGRKELVEGRKELVDGRKELVEGRDPGAYVREGERKVKSFHICNSPS